MSPCFDCGMDTYPIDRRHTRKSEDYMVHDDVWAKAGGIEGLLCVGCIEARLGRPLTRVDFIEAPINFPDPFHTDRLASRLASIPNYVIALRRAWKVVEGLCPSCSSGAKCSCDGCTGWCPHTDVADDHLLACFCEPFCFCEPRTPDEVGLFMARAMHSLVALGVGDGA